MEQTEERKRPDVERAYKNESIIVYWEPTLCVHERNCVKGLPSVFQPFSRPWIKIDGADASLLAQVISTCPSGALRFERLDGGPQEKPAEPTVVSPQPDGPLYVRGRIEILDENGELSREVMRAALCRCGHSSNKPFCDESHKRVGFKTG